MVPVATERVFDDRWRPGCEALGLEWVPLFKTGTPVGADELETVIAELERLRAWMGERPGGDYERERVALVIAELAKLRGARDVEIFIG